MKWTCTTCNKELHIVHKKGEILTCYKCYKPITEEQLHLNHIELWKRNGTDLLWVDQE